LLSLIASEEKSKSSDKVFLAHYEPLFKEFIDAKCSLAKVSFLEFHLIAYLEKKKISKNDSYSAPRNLLKLICLKSGINLGLYIYIVIYALLTQDQTRTFSHIIQTC
jgi:hypothetical protein